MILLWFYLFFGTMILEDIALGTALIWASQGDITWIAAFSACFLGIVLGNVILFYIGRAAQQSSRIYHSRLFSRVRHLIQDGEKKGILTGALVLCRFLPGTRIATYLLSGYSGYRFSKFFALSVATGLLWVALAFSVGQSLKALIAENMFLAFVVIIILFALIKNLIAQCSKYWSRKAYLQSWRRWLSFEFWPTWFFYIPLVPRYIYLSLKYRNFLLPFYVNPAVQHAGLIGGSKWDFYRNLQPTDFSLKTGLIKYSENQSHDLRIFIEQQGLSYPLVLKPDEGKHGFGVRVIQNETELQEYLHYVEFDLIVQEHCPWMNEVGIVYYRLPSQRFGQIFSITDKDFPIVWGDGVTPLGQLILDDPRARIMASTYFSRFAGQLDTIPKANDKIYISTCGNHDQGAIFRNGEALYSQALMESIEYLAQRFPGFYYGRFDLRYKSKEDLMRGENFKIVELNGARGEASHIRDAATRLIDAYRTLYRQWGLLFEIGHQVRLKAPIYPRFELKKIFGDVRNIRHHNKNLAVSS